MAISYPVDSNSKWSVYDLNTLSVIASNKNWPRGDGGEIQGLVSNVVYLLEVKLIGQNDLYKQRYLLKIIIKNYMILNFSY